MTAVETTTEKIFGMLKVYDLLVYKHGDTSLSQQAATTGQPKYCEPHMTQSIVDTEQTNTGSQTQHTSEPCTTQETIQESAKDKLVDDDPNLNLIVPNSDGENDDVFVNEKLSTPFLCTSMSITAVDAVTPTRRISGQEGNVQQMARMGASNSQYSPAKVTI